MAVIAVYTFTADDEEVTKTKLNNLAANLLAEFNGSIDNDNVKAAAAIAYSKLNLTGALLNADVNASAAIVDTKLAQITTAAKVSGAALSTLGSIPATGGTVPPANVRKTLVLKATADAETVTTGDGKIYFTCPAELTGMDLVAVYASILTASSSGTPTIQIARGRRTAVDGVLSYADMLSTRITIDAGEYDSNSATAAAVIDTTKDDIVSSTYADVLRVDVDVAGTGAVGLEIRLSFQTP